MRCCMPHLRSTREALAAASVLLPVKQGHGYQLAGRVHFMGGGEDPVRAGCDSEVAEAWGSCVSVSFF